VVRDPVQAIDRGHRRNALTVSALICGIALLAGCGGSGGSGSSADSKKLPQYLTVPAVGSVRTADCSDWKKGSVDQRRSTVFQLRKFAGGPVGSSEGIQRGPVLEDGRAYRILESYCARYFARGFKLYKVYERAAAFVGH
jgi:hypothetical protein